MRLSLMLAVFCISLLSFHPLNAQSKKSKESNASVLDEAVKTKLAKIEDSLIIYADSLRIGIIPQEKAYYNERFVRLLKQALTEPNSYLYPFDRLKDYIHIIYPEDNAFRIFNWVVIVNDFSRRYYGAIQMNAPELILYPLLDYSEELEDKGRALEQVTNKEWYGGEIYNIYKLPGVTEQGQPVYAIFLYNNNAVFSKKKILDHMVILPSGPVFGLPIIQLPEATLNRLIIEYKKEAFVNLNYNKEEKKIIFDRTASEIGDPNKRFTYVPTGNMDGFVLQKGKWMYVPDAIPIMRLRDGEAPIDGVFPR